MNVARLYAWGVHLYTAMGLVIAAAIAHLLVGDHPERFRFAFLLMGLAVAIDSTDGWLARRARVKEVLPEFDGRRLDDIVDFLNYTFLPLLLVYQARLLPDGQSGWLLVPLVASAYGFCQSSAKTEDGFFLGFPSYWNLVAFYLYMLRPAAWMAIGLVVVLSVLTFVPTRYLYPSQRGAINRVTMALGGVWAAVLILILWTAAPEGGPAGEAAAGGTQLVSLLSPPAEGFAREHAALLTLVSLCYPAYYLVASWVVSMNVGTGSGVPSGAKLAD